jgi:hypothetical protein
VRPSEQVDDAVVGTTPATAAFVAGLERNQAALYPFARRLVGDGKEAPAIAVDAASNLWLMYSSQDRVGIARLSPDGVEQDVVTVPRSKVVVAGTAPIQAVIETGDLAWPIRVSGSSSV